MPACIRDENAKLSISTRESREGEREGGEGRTEGMMGGGPQRRKLSAGNECDRRDWSERESERGRERGRGDDIISSHEVQQHR